MHGEPSHPGNSNVHAHTAHTAHTANTPPDNKCQGPGDGRRRLSCAPAWPVGLPPGSRSAPECCNGWLRRFQGTPACLGART